MTSCFVLMMSCEIAMYNYTILELPSWHKVYDLQYVLYGLKLNSQQVSVHYAFLYVLSILNYRNQLIRKQFVTFVTLYNNSKMMSLIPTWWWFPFRHHMQTLYTAKTFRLKLSMSWGV